MCHFMEISTQWENAEAGIQHHGQLHGSPSDTAGPVRSFLQVNKSKTRLSNNWPSEDGTTVLAANLVVTGQI